MERQRSEAHDLDLGLETAKQVLDYPGVVFRELDRIGFMLSRCNYISPWDIVLSMDWIHYLIIPFHDDEYKKDWDAFKVKLREFGLSSEQYRSEHHYWPSGSARMSALLAFSSVSGAVMRCLHRHGFLVEQLRGERI